MILQTTPMNSQLLPQLAAVEIMRKGPRTREYSCGISDGKTERAVDIGATPDGFDLVPPGQCFGRLPCPVEDAVLMSAGDHYAELIRRVKSHYRKLDAQGAHDLMKRRVCLTPDIHCAVFAPETLDFWVAKADSQNPAAPTHFANYNLAEMLRPDKTK